MIGHKLSDEQAVVDIEALMKEIRAQVKEEIGSGSYLVGAGKIARKAPETPGVEDSIIYSEHLNYLNAHWHDWVKETEITSHRRFLGKAIVAVKRFIGSSVWEYILKDYLAAERNYNSQMVRYLNANARYIDSRVGDIFWQLIRKIDADIDQVREQMAHTREEARATFVSLGLEVREQMAKEDERAQKLEQAQQHVRTVLSKTEEMIRGLERGLAVLSRPVSSSSQVSSYAETGEVIARERLPDNEVPDLRYYLFENRFRGSEEDIKQRQLQYANLYKGIEGKILEIGCGRGELLDVFRKSGLNAWGVDLDTAMAERAREKGLDVEVGDGLAVLEKQADCSLGGLIALQFVEHLSNNQLYSLLDLIWAKLEHGGKVLLETINPQSFAALARNFFRDPTHRWPFHPDTLKMLLEMKGFETEEIIYSAPYPSSSLLAEVPIETHLPARWMHTLEMINDNMRRLNDLLFGHQDYAIVATKKAQRA